ncbi:hypothetical protein [Amycolatopsis sp. NPDC051372]|uniref:hypothetical protein n=1 Tax=unclassified Amycolatopsis TaxID=2618356 RepID=UPI0034285798
MDMWHEAVDELNAIDAEHGESFTIDQKHKHVEVMALLSIAQELSRIQDQGINPKWSAKGD